MAVDQLATPRSLDAQRQQFEREGYVVIENALPPDVVGRLVETSERVSERHRKDGAPLHLLGIVTHDELFLDLIDWPATFPLVSEILGWNIFVNHTHLDVHPRLERHAEPQELPWHQDGRRLVHDIETQPPPLLSLKVSFWLTDVSDPDNGPMHILPGSHMTAEPPEPGERGVPLLVRPGTAVVHDRRVWHARGFNYSDVTRMAVFIGYAYRWLRSRDPMRRLAPEGLDPVRRQLLDLPFPREDAMSYFVPGDEDVPLRALMAERNAAR